MIVIDNVVEEVHRMLLTNDGNELESITLPSGTTHVLSPAACDTLLSSRSSVCCVAESPQFLQLGYLHETLKLIESVLTNYHELFRKVRLPFPLPI